MSKKKAKRKKNKKSKKAKIKWSIVSIGANIVLGIVSVLLGIYSLKLQAQATHTREILQKLEEELSILRDTVSSPEKLSVINYLKRQIPSSYVTYSRVLNKFADSLEYYNKKIQVAERKILENLPPNDPYLKLPPLWKGYIKESGWIFDIISSPTIVEISKDTPIRILLKLKIPPTEVLCLQVLLEKGHYIIASYQYLPQGKYNKLELPKVDFTDEKDSLNLVVGIYLKEDTLKKYPRFFAKRVKLLLVP